MDNMDLSDLMGVFLDEAEEQLLKLDDGILQLEKDPSNAETIKEVFRAAHTLKGSSATMGFTEIADLMHAMESLLDCVRNGTVEVGSEIVDLLLAGNDALRGLMDQLRAGEPLAADADELKANLRAACVNEGAKPAGVASSKAAGKTTDAQGVEPGNMRLTIKIADNCLMPSVRAFMIHSVLSGLGDIVSQDPKEDAMDDLTAGQQIIIEFKPSADPSAVTDAIKSLAEVELVDAVLPKADAAKRGAKAKPTSSGETATEQQPRAIQTVRVGVDRLDTLMNLVAELVIDRTRISQIEGNLMVECDNEDLVRNLGETAAHIGRVVTELQEHIMKVRLLPVDQVFNRFPRMVRDLSHKAGKELEFILEGQDTELDRSILEDIVDPLTHLLRNAVDHGVESPEDRVAAGKPRTARVVLAAKQEEDRIIIEVEDDGKGIDVERVKQSALKKGIVTEDTLSRMSEEDCLQLIFAPGLSTAEKVTDVSGRGVGMDVVRNNIQGLSGSVDVQTEVGKGTRFRISLPLTLAIIQALVTSVDDRVFVIPLSAVVETFRCDEADVRYIDGKPAMNFRGSVLPLVRLGSLFECPQREAVSRKTSSTTFVVINTGSLRIGLIVDKLIGEQEVVIKPLGSFFGDLRGIAGATILGDGHVALIVDVTGVAAILNRRRFSREPLAVAEA